MDGFTADSVRELDAERRKTAAVIRLPRKEAQSGFDKCVEEFFCRKIPRVTRYTRPSGIHRIMPRSALHLGQTATDLAAYPLQLAFVLAPSYHIEMCADRSQSP